MKLLDGVMADATFSVCGRYRLALRRSWFPERGAGHVLWVMLNPSTASAEVDDPTIRKCQKFARTWGYDGIVVANIFALRATKPEEMLAHPEPIGDGNNLVLESLLMAEGIGLAMAAWGVHGAHRGRGQEVVSMAASAGRELHVLGLTKEGHPRHPLYVPDAAGPIPWCGR